LRISIVKKRIRNRHVIHSEITCNSFPILSVIYISNARYFQWSLLQYCGICFLLTCSMSILRLAQCGVNGGSTLDLAESYKNFSHTHTHTKKKKKKKKMPILVTFQSSQSNSDWSEFQDIHENWSRFGVCTKSSIVWPTTIRDVVKHLSAFVTLEDLRRGFFRTSVSKLEVIFAMSNPVPKNRFWHYWGTSCSKRCFCFGNVFLDWTILQSFKTCGLEKWIVKMWRDVWRVTSWWRQKHRQSADFSKVCIWIQTVLKFLIHHVFTKLSITFIDHIWIKFTVDRHWTICIFIFMTSSNLTSKQSWNSWFLMFFIE
jgi:hypothetical protein